MLNHVEPDEISPNRIDRSQEPAEDMLEIPQSPIDHTCIISAIAMRMDTRFSRYIPMVSVEEKTWEAEAHMLTVGLIDTLGKGRDPICINEG